MTSVIIIRSHWFLWSKNSVFRLWVSPHFRLPCDVLFLDLNFYSVASGSTSPVFGPVSFADQVSNQSSGVFHWVSEPGGVSRPVTRTSICEPGFCAKSIEQPESSVSDFALAFLSHRSWGLWSWLDFFCYHRLISVRIREVLFHSTSLPLALFFFVAARLFVCLSQPGAHVGLRCCERATRCPVFTLRWSSHLRAQKHASRALDSPPPWVKKCFSRASLKIDWLLLQYAAPYSSFMILFPLMRESIWFTLIMLCAAWKRDHSWCGFSHLTLLLSEFVLAPRLSASARFRTPISLSVSVHWGRIFILFLQVSRSCSSAIGSKTRVFLVLISFLWWLLGHAHKMFDEICERQWIVLVVWFLLPKPHT
jgi:hypothetical protein